MGGDPMASGEIDGTTWLGPARWYTSGRDGKAIRFVVIHYTAGAEGRTAAEDGAAYDKRRPDKVSTHFFADQDSVVQEVRLADQAYAAFGKGNRLGVQIEICGTLQTRAGWLDPVSDATITNAARVTAELCKRYGLEPRRLSLPEVSAAWNNFPNGPRGIVGHVDCTVAYGQGDHIDPGPEFPWDVFLGRVQNFMKYGQPSISAIGGKSMWVVQLNQPAAKTWWKTDTLRSAQLVTWGDVMWTCARYGQGPYDLQISDLAEFRRLTGREDVVVDPDPAGVNIAPE